MAMIQKPPRAVRNDPLIMLEAAIEGISYSLSQLHDFDCSKLSGPQFIDLTARLNAQVNGLEKILEPMKSQLKAEGLANNDFILKGKAYQAVITKITKTVLDTVKIKDFLGKNLFKYQKDQEQTSLTFCVKE